MSEPEIPQSTMPEVVVLNVSFDDDYAALQITYVEARHVGTRGFKQDVLTVPAEVLNKEELSDVVDSILHFIDQGLVDIRTEGQV